MATDPKQNLFSLISTSFSAFFLEKKKKKEKKIYILQLHLWLQGVSHPALLFLRELLRHTSACPRERREPPRHLPGTPQPAQKLPDAQQIAQQPGEGCRGRRQQRGRLRPVRQVSINQLSPELSHTHGFCLAF